MVRIRLRRVGKKKQPSFRMVAADKESPRDGRFLEILGFYNPRTEPATIKLKEERIFDWMSKGAQLSDGAKGVMRAAGALERYDRFVAGEDIQKLLEEAAAGDAARNISAKTRHDPPAGKPKAKPKAEEPKAAKASEKEIKAEEPKVDETPVEEKVEAEAEEAAAVEKSPKESKAPAEEPKAEAPSEKKAEEKAEKVPTEEKDQEKGEDAPAVTSSRALVEKLELPANITTVLVEGGYKTVGKLAKQMESDSAEILELSGIGPKALETIEEKIKAFQP